MQLLAFLQASLGHRQALLRHLVHLLSISALLQCRVETVTMPGRPFQETEAASLSLVKAPSWTLVDWARSLKMLETLHLVYSVVFVGQLMASHCNDICLNTSMIIWGCHHHIYSRVL
jgi:hypothetical protein